jgi:GNAT superfamily N-acetyltransferase
MNHMTILPLSNAHRDVAAALILPIQQVEFNVPITLADQPDLLDLEAAYFRSGGHFWGAFVGEELVGTIGLLAPAVSNGRPAHSGTAGGLPFSGPGAAPAPFGVIRKMFVKPQFRGKSWGVAQRLLETLIGHARRSGMEHLYLGTIGRMHAAHRFYEKNGFTRIAKDRLPATFPLMAVDDTFYQLSLL